MDNLENLDNIEKSSSSGSHTRPDSVTQNRSTDVATQIITAPNNPPPSGPLQDATVGTMMASSAIIPMPVAPPIPQLNRNIPDFSEYGKTGIRRFTGRVYEEFLQILRGLQGVRVYREMADNDDIVGTSLYAMERVVAQASWNVVPYDDSNESLRDAQFLEQCKSDMEHSWSDFILEANTCLTYGWSMLEEVYKLRKGDNLDKRLNSKYNDGYVGWRKFSRRLQSTLYIWDFEDNGDIKGMVQNPPPEYIFRYVPMDKSLLFRTKLDGNNPEGRSLLRNAYKPYYYKKHLQLIEAIGVERDLIGIPVLTPPPEWDITDPNNKALLAYAERVLANLRRDEQEGIFLPPGWTISLLSIGTSRRQYDLDKIINRYDKRIAMTMLAQFVMLGMDRVGSFALSTDQNDFFKLAVQSYINRSADTINNFAVPRLFRLNPSMGHDGKLPKFVPSNISTPKLSEFAAFINSLAKAAILPTNDTKLIQAILRVGRFDEQTTAAVGDLYAPHENKYTGSTSITKPATEKDINSDNPNSNSDTRITTNSNGGGNNGRNINKPKLALTSGAVTTAKKPNNTNGNSNNNHNTDITAKNAERDKKIGLA